MGLFGSSFAMAALLLILTLLTRGHLFTILTEQSLNEILLQLYLPTSLISIAAAGSSRWWHRVTMKRAAFWGAAFGLTMMLFLTVFVI